MKRAGRETGEIGYAERCVVGGTAPESLQRVWHRLQREEKDGRLWKGDGLEASAEAAQHRAAYDAEELREDALTRLFLRVDTMETGAGGS